MNKLNFSIQYSDQESQPYYHSYKYLPENQGHWEIQSRRYALQYNHILSANSYLVFNASFLDHRSLYRVGDLHYNDYIFPVSDENLEFKIGGNSKGYSDLKSQTYNLKGSWVFQLGRHHEFKSGFEYNQHDLDVFDYSNEGNDEEKFFLNQYKKHPVTASLFLQDKIEYSSIIINAGVRGDYVDVKADAFKNIENPYSGLEDTEPELKISPRLGLAYPISENTVLHFSYGHFFQFPNFQSIYQNLQFLNVEELKRAKFALVANPKVKSQKTTSYEFGVSQGIGNDYALKLTAYSKDITDLLGTINVDTKCRYVIFTNNDFARIQGVDLSFEKRMRDYWAAKIDYTYSVARGNEARPTEEAYNIWTGKPKSIKEFYLDFDRRHDFSVNFLLALPDRFGPQVLGFHPIGKLNFSLLAQFSSGLPYTPISDDRTKYFEKNSARMPWTKSVDFRIEKFVPVSLFDFSVFLEVTNVFDWLNPLVVQPRTGKVWDDGKSHLFGTGKDYMHDPSDVGPPRIIKLGTSISM
jgi:outer membrane receptor protein involved in Fe transport